MTDTLLGQHREHDQVCFGGAGARDAGQLLAYASAIAETLHGPPGSQVVLACRDRYPFCAGLLAALQRGLIALLPESGQPDVIRGLMQRHGVGALLRDGAGDDGVDVRTLERPEQRRPLPFVSARTMDDTAVIAFTSGSTGAPQAHPKSLGQLSVEPASHVRQFGLAQQRIVCAVPPHHIYGLLFSVFMPLLGGGSVLRDTPLFPEAILTAIGRFDASVLVAAPAHLTALSQYEAPALPRMRRVFSSAGPLPETTQRALSARGLPVTEVLGSTETGGIAFRAGAGDAWTPFPGVQISADEHGVLQVAVPWRDPHGPAVVRTADRVRLAGAGFYHLGRTDSVVKIGGRRIDLRDVEQQLMRAPGVSEARVIAVDDAESARGTNLWAVVAGCGVDVPQLRRALAERFDPVTWPRRFRLVARLPVNATGKVTRQSLLSLFESGERDVSV